MSMIGWADAEEKEQIYGLLTERLPDDFGSVEAVLLEADWDAEQLQASLRMLDRAIDESDSDRRTGRLVEQRLRLMEKMGAGREQIQAYLSQFHRLPVVRQKEIGNCIARGDDQTAIALLRESKVLDGNEIELVTRYSKQLAELYRRTGQEKLYEQELRYLVFSCPCRDIEHVKRLKELTPAAQWPALFEQVLRQPSMKINRRDLLAWDGQYQGLYELLLQAMWPDKVDRYELTLRSWSPERTRALYLQCLNRTIR